MTEAIGCPSTQMPSLFGHYDCFTKFSTDLQPRSIQSRGGGLNKITVWHDLWKIHTFITWLLYMTWVSLNCTFVPHSWTPIRISRVSFPVNSQPESYFFYKSSELDCKHDKMKYPWNEFWDSLEKRVYGEKWINVLFGLRICRVYRYICNKQVTAHWSYVLKWLVQLKI